MVSCEELFGTKINVNKIIGAYDEVIILLNII